MRPGRGFDLFVLNCVDFGLGFIFLRLKVFVFTPNSCHVVERLDLTTINDRTFQDQLFRMLCRLVKLKYNVYPPGAPEIF